MTVEEISRRAKEKFIKAKKEFKNGDFFKVADKVKLFYRKTILMEIFDIKRGDILVMEYNDINVAERRRFERDYIIFIASGYNPSISGGGKGYICYSIPVIASIDLSNTLETETCKINLSIGYTIYFIEKRKTTTVKKPTFSEMTELINRLKENGYKYNKKTKNIEKL